MLRAEQNKCDRSVHTITFVPSLCGSIKTDDKIECSLAYAYITIIR